MPRLARAVIPGLPHHVVQRGNRRQQTFFKADDYDLYRRLVAEWARAAGVEVWAYCLMPNHVHLILTPATVEGLRQALGEAHRRYTRHVNARQGWTGHLWQGRFASAPMDEAHLMAAFHYVALNPVRAGAGGDGAGLAVVERVRAPAQAWRRPGPGAAAAGPRGRCRRLLRRRRR